MDSSNPIRSYFAVVATIFCPLVAGYFLSYAFRTVNAPLTGLLTQEFSLDPAQLGFLTSCYFVTATVAQLPLGLAFDRYGPGRVQGSLMLLAALGAALFAVADGFVELAVGRALIGLGVAGALMAGMKANVMSLPKESVPLMNGAFVAIGSAGALATSLPLDWLLTLISWRELFLWLATASAVSAVLILALVPHMPTAAGSGGAKPYGLTQIVTDARFWRLAPLSALICGSAWAMQGLWVASWLRDVAAMDRTALANALFVMATALCAGALCYGVALDRLRRRGIGSDRVFSAIAAAVIAAEIAMAFHWPVPPYLLLICIGASGAATVVSYSITPQLFPPAAVARANSALNVLHFGVAFSVQNLIGIILNLWVPGPGRHYPETAYGAAFLAIAAMQAAALVWFVCNAKPSEAGVSVKTTRKPSLVAAYWVAALLIVAGFFLWPFANAIVGGHVDVAATSLSARYADAGQSSPTYGATMSANMAAMSDTLLAQFTEQKTQLAFLQTQLESYHSETRQIRPELAYLRQQLAELQTILARPVSSVTTSATSPQGADARIDSADDARAATQLETSTTGGTIARQSVGGQNCDLLISDVKAPIVIEFGRDQDFLSTSQFGQLDGVVHAALKCTQVVIEIRGYSDNRGSENLNAAISMKRAALTAKYFKAHGIAADRLLVGGFGATHSLASNARPDGRARNRRVEVTFRPSH